MPLSHVPDVAERIRIQHDQIGSESCCDHAAIGPAGECRRIRGGCAKDVSRPQARVTELGELVEC
jgi:hypothetical protein